MVSFQLGQSSTADSILRLKPMQHRVYVISKRLPKVLTQRRRELAPCRTCSASEGLEPERALAVFLLSLRADAVSSSPGAAPVPLRVRSQQAVPETPPMTSDMQAESSLPGALLGVVSGAVPLKHFQLYPSGSLRDPPMQCCFFSVAAPE